MLIHRNERITDLTDSSGQWQKVREVFDSALRRRPEERREYVDEVCGDNKTLRAEVESLLLSHEGAESFMEVPVTCLLSVLPFCICVSDKETTLSSRVLKSRIVAQNIELGVNLELGN